MQALGKFEADTTAIRVSSCMPMSEKLSQAQSSAIIEQEMLLLRVAG